jgi:hypothetical protein
MVGFLKPGAINGPLLATLRLRGSIPSLLTSSMNEERKMDSILVSIINAFNF